MSDSERLTRLETHFEYVRDGLAELKAGQKELSAAVGSIQTDVKKLPTKDDLWAWRVQWLVIGLTAAAVMVGGIIGGLDWIKVH